MSGAIPVKRGCGTREQGGIYAEVGVSAFGLPLEDFLLDPPTPLNPALGVSPIGVTLIKTTDENEEVYHIADWVGANNYPNVWDFLGEARNFGISRRLPKSLDFSKISAKSRLLCIHPRAIITNAERYTGHSPEGFGQWVGETERTAPATVPVGARWKPGRVLYGGWKCVKGFASHDPIHDPKPCCSGIWGQDIEGGTDLTKAEREKYASKGKITTVDGAVYDATDSRLILRVMPSFRYIARRPPDSAEGIYIAAFFASFPLSRIVVVQGEGDAPALEKANSSGVKVNVVRE